MVYYVNYIYKKNYHMCQRTQLVRIRKNTLEKLTTIQLLLSVQEKSILSKSNALDIILNEFMSTLVKENL